MSRNLRIGLGLAGLVVIGVVWVWIAGSNRGRDREKVDSSPRRGEERAPPEMRDRNPGPGQREPARPSPSEKAEGAVDSAEGSAPTPSRNRAVERDTSKTGERRSADAVAPPVDAFSDSSAAVRRRAVERAVKKAVDAIRSDLESCYRHLLEEFPEASGDVVVSFEMSAPADAGSSVEVARIGEGTSLMEDRLQTCVLEAVGEIEADLPTSMDQTTVTYPFHFRTGASADGGR